MQALLEGGDRFSAVPLTSAVIVESREHVLPRMRASSSSRSIATASRG